VSFRNFVLCLAVTFLAGSACSLNAGVIASSTFNTNDEGWTNRDLLTITGSPGPVTYLATGGNPGGHIQSADNFNWNAFYAPAAFLGDQWAAYLGTLTFDVYDNFTDSGSSPAVMISDGTTILYSALLVDSTVQGPAWHSLSVQFLASTGWTDSAFAGGNAASEAQLQAVLANLQVLAVGADFATGGDDVHLDDVVLSSSAPEPTSVLMFLGGLSLVVAKARKRA
jgi:hypothetical protein